MSAPGQVARRTAARAGCAALLLAAALQASAAPAGFQDTLAQRLRACTGCHGPDGRAASDGFHPRIAGKPAGYLYRQLRAFRDGQRRYALMGTLLAPLDDAYLREIAGYFATLELPYPPPAPPRADATTLRRGQQLARDGDPARRIPACGSCHGPALTGIGDDLPGLLGLPVDYLNAQLGAWRTGARQAAAPDCMAQIARQLSDEDASALAHWLAAQPVPTAPRPAAPASPLPLRCGSLDGTK